MSEQGIIGLSIGIINNGKLVLAKGYGKANFELNVSASEKTIYKIGSLSKQFIAAAIMKLVEEGKLKVTDRVTTFIKAAPPAWNSITIRHLLNHTSGVPVDPPGFDGTKDLPDSFYIRRAFSDTLAFPPGSKFQYSNFGYFILADIIRITTGQSFLKYMTQNIFNPYGMSNTQPTSLENIVVGRAGGYLKKEDHSIVNAPNYIAVRPSGAFLSSIADLLKWEMVMQQNKLLSESGWKQMWNDTVQTSFTMDNEEIYSGYGWMTNKIKEQTFIHHGGSMPGFQSVYFRYPDSKSAIIILTNADKADMYAIGYGVRELLQKEK